MCMHHVSGCKTSGENTASAQITIFLSSLRCCSGMKAITHTTNGKKPPYWDQGSADADFTYTPVSHMSQKRQRWTTLELHTWCLLDASQRMCGLSCFSASAPMSSKHKGWRAVIYALTPAAVSHAKNTLQKHTAISLALLSTLL